MRPTILVTGSSGQLGFELLRALAPLGKVHALVRAEFDLARPERMQAWLDRVRPDIIVNAAAYTAVDQAESKQALAFALNAAAPELMARWAGAHGALMVQYSTDYVFDGSKSGRYVESDVPGTRMIYGASKLAGEQAVLAHAPRSLVLRVGWLFSAFGNNFLHTILRLALERTSLSIVADQIGTPTSTQLVADVTAHMLSASLSGKLSEPWGIYHVAAAGEASWHEYARHIVHELTLDGVKLACAEADVRAIGSSEWPTPALRPANSRLDCSKLTQNFGLNLPHWHEGVSYALAQLLRSGALRHTRWTQGARRAR
ncbi:dTDP-4-dehydrorhamnose reductase [Craterilacuibacter sp. RT1T]|uniref:dTDP-4-dehydrorhamnose reductase n=1 Tax=Craterilacuibacter sp. RT1T TaxID=2942211 RepID=UPI0020BF0E8D|nr:dTDP-4-dehydrorhamnose reductase [Craterilacuibacter sp. RT1T]MCL6264736.1 dTDP-4-dehydrorhamnose reductase [Craterilacuibacter sp. RT1T]